MTDLFDAAADRCAYESGKARSQVHAEIMGGPSKPALPPDGLFKRRSTQAVLTIEGPYRHVTLDLARKYRKGKLLIP